MTSLPDEAPRGLLALPRRLAELHGEARARADRLLDVRLADARTEPPSALEPWILRTFGSVEAVREQTVVKVTNLATLEATLFAPLRSRRPIDGLAGRQDLDAEITATGGDPFCDAETGTPAHRFGRVRGRRVMTGANAAAADANHAVLIFDTHDPLAFDAELVSDVLATGHAWAELARAEDPEATRYLLIWNCLWRAGGSIIHGHAQALLGSGPHYARLERLRRDADRYAAETGSSLVEDLVAMHDDLGLATRRAGGVHVLAHVTPIKEREVLVVGRPGMDERDPAFADAVAATLIGFRDRLGVRSFNVGLWRPPLDEPAEWSWLPPVVRIVDRGDPFQRSSDIGGLELYGTPVVASDPYEVIGAIG